MKIDFSQVLVDLDNKPIKDRDKDFTLGAAATVGLLNSYEDERPTGQEKSARYALAIKIHGANSHPVDLDIDDIKLVRDLVAKAYSPLVAGQVWLLLDGKDKAD